MNPEAQTSTPRQESKEIVELPVSLDFSRGRLKDPSGHTLADLRYAQSSIEFREFLVRALNCHTELLEALKAMVEVARAENWQSAFTGRQIILEESEKIIAKAEGGSK